MITIIAAISKNNALGKNNKMLWHLPNDFKHFKNITAGNIIIMGRKTFESLPGVLPNRKHIIITRNKNYKVPEGCEIFYNLDDAINFYKNKQIFIIGGGEIYKLALPFTNTMELTIVDSVFDDADAYFPEFNFNEWKIIHKEDFKADDKHKYAYTFLTLNRNK